MALRQHQRARRGRIPAPRLGARPRADGLSRSLAARPRRAGGYAGRFLRQAPGSDAREAEYEALKNGQAPEDDPQFRGYAVDKADAPAVDVQQAGGAYQRLTLAIVVLSGSLGMVCLLGFLSLAVRDRRRRVGRRSVSGLSSSSRLRPCR